MRLASLQRPAIALFCLLLTLPARGQDAAPLILSGELTAQDPFDKVRKDCFHDVHELDLKAGEIYLIELKSLEFEPILRLEDEAGQKIIEHDSFGEILPDARIGYAPKKSGRYRAVATTRGGGASGKYTIRLGELKRVGEPKRMEGKLTETSPKDDMDRYTQEHSVKHSAGEFWQIDLMSQDFDPLLEAFTSKGKSIASDNNGGERLNSRLVLGFDESGEHLLHVTGLAVGAKGSYTLQHQLLDRSQAVELTHEERCWIEARDLIRRGIDHFESGQFPEAEKAYRRSVGLLEGLNPPSKYPRCQADLAACLGNLANLHIYRSEYAQAVPLLRQAQEIFRRVLGEKHPQYLGTLNGLAIVRWKEGAYKESEALFQQALDIRKRVLGENDPEFAASLINLGAFYSEQGAPLQAEALLKQALHIHRDVLKAKDPGFAACLVNLAIVHRKRRAYVDAEPLFQQALKILGTNHRDFPTCLNQLAILYDEQENYSKAERLYKQALEMQLQAHGENHLGCADSLNNLAMLAWKQGDYAKARPALQRSLEIKRQVLGEEHPELASSRNNLALLYWKQDAPAEAEQEMARALQIYRQHKHPELAVCLNNAGVLQLNQEAYAKAKPLFLEALKIHEERHPHFATSLNNLAILHEKQGDYPEAGRLYEQALDLRQQILGDKHPDFAHSLAGLALLRLRQGDGQAAELGGRRAVGIIADHLEVIAAVQTERVQLTFLSLQRDFLDEYLSFSSAANTPADEAYAIVLPWKGAVTSRQRQARFTRTALADGNQETFRVFAQLDLVSRQFSNLTNQPVDPKTAADLPKRLSELFAERERLEIELAQRTEGFRKLRQAKKMTPARLQESLPEGTALVDFLVYRKLEPKARQSVKSLVAFVITNNNVQRIELGAMAPLTTAIDNFLPTMKRGRPVLNPQDPALILRNKLWQPLAEHFKGAKIVLISPDGPLCRLPFAALPTADGKRYLLEDLMLAVLPVPQLLPELLAPRNRPPEAPPSMLAIGYIDYDAAPAAAEEVPLEQLPWNRFRPAGEAKPLHRLDGTEGELFKIQDAFPKAVPKGKLSILRDAQATEAEVRRLAPQFELLHLATHGLFAPQEVPSATKRADKNQDLGNVALRQALDAQQSYQGTHPGLLSSLALAGANKPQPDDDALLTALEVADLDLSKMELAVLSACDTGLGEVAGGEGVLGLQRAFQIAGARATITSFWKVDDDPTRKLMVRFYHSYWTKKNMGTLAALREAQLWMLAGDSPRGLVRVQDQEDPPRLAPFYWAAFSLAGDWR